jgi:hypothetical protein
MRARMASTWAVEIRPASQAARVAGRARSLRARDTTRWAWLWVVRSTVRTQAAMEVACSRSHSSAASTSPIPAASLASSMSRDRSRPPMSSQPTGTPRSPMAVITATASAPTEPPAARAPTGSATTLITHKPTKGV